MATIQGVYVALFGRPADPTGLAYFNSVTKNGADLNGIGDLASTQEYKDRFAGQSNLQIVTSIYQSLFNRDPEAAGLNFFTDALNKGTLSIKNIAIAILDGAQGTDKTIVTNKITAADNFTKALDTPVEVAAYTGNAAAAQGRAFLTPVGVNPNTIPSAAATDAAIVALTSVATGGVSLSIKDADASTLSTTATDSKLKTTGGDDTVTVTDAYTAASKIDTGLGVDTLVLKNLAGAVVPGDGAIANVEKLVVTSTNDAAALNLDKAGSITSITSDNTGVAAADAKNVAFTNIASGATLAVKGNAADTSFTFKDSQSGTTSLSLDKVANAAAADTITIVNGSSTVAVSTTGGSAFILKDADAKVVNLSGSGDLKMSLDAATTKIATLDASALSGKLNVDLTGDTVAVKVTGTLNADTIKLDAAAATADTVIYNKADASNYGLAETVDGFIKAEDKMDLKSFGFTKTGVATLSNITDNAAVFGTSSVAVYAVGANDAWVFADKNGDGVLNLGTDFAVHVTGTGAGSIDATNIILS